MGNAAEICADTHQLTREQQVVAEVVATFLLVFVTCGSASLTTSDHRKVSQLRDSVYGGLIVTIMIYAVGHISGACMNPAVTLAFATNGHFPWPQFRASIQLQFDFHGALYNLGTVLYGLAGDTSRTKGTMGGHDYVASRSGKVKRIHG